MPNYPYENDRVTIPEGMDKNLNKYDVGEELSGTMGFTVDKKDSKEIVLCIKKFDCKPQVRMKPEEDGI